MEYRQLGRSGLRISTLTLGTMTFGGRGDFQKVGSTDTSGARLLVDRCLDAGVNVIDTADVYSNGVSEEIVGAAIEGRRDRLLVATKARIPIGDGASCVQCLAQFRARLYDLRVGRYWAIARRHAEHQFRRSGVRSGVGKHADILRRGARRVAPRRAVTEVPSLEGVGTHH